MKYVIRNHIGLVLYININVYGFESGLGPIKSTGVSPRSDTLDLW